MSLVYHFYYTNVREIFGLHVGSTHSEYEDALNVDSHLSEGFFDDLVKMYEGFPTKQKHGIIRLSSHARQVMRVLFKPV